MKIKISTNSWHYRWQKFLGECFNNRFYPSASICGYFWGFWLNNGAALFVVVILTLLAAIAAYLVVGPFVLAWSWLVNGSAKAGATMAITLGVDVGLAVAIFSDQIKDKYRETRTTVGETSMAQVSREYFSAVKSKVCPVVEYIDDFK